MTHFPYEVRSLTSRLSAGVRELQLDLAFDVEAYVDSLLIPEMPMERVQSSLRDAFGIRESLDNSARMVGRLTSVINARSATLIALPPTLLLTFFGINGTNVHADRSLLDVGSTARRTRRPGFPSRSSS